MRRHAGLFGIICLIILGVVAGGAAISNVSALSYQSNVGVGFTFNPTLSVSLSNSDLVINNLSPNTSSDSNIITVNIATNAAYGYDLFSTVGNTTNATTELKNGNNSFTSLSSNVAAPASFDDNKWGYSYSTDSGSSWVSGDYGSTSAGYAGLPLYTGTGVKLASANSNTDSSVQFKIAAKAGATQASGEYTNVVNFTAVSKVAPVSLLDAFAASGAEQLNGYYKMQDMTGEICDSIEIEHSTINLIDARDNKVYKVAKLKDGKCWMTQSLDLAGGTALYSDTSDVPDGYSVSGGTPYYTLPASSTIGFDDVSKAYVYNVPSGDPNHSNCETGNPCYSYYSWLAATVGGKDIGGNIVSTRNDSAAYSICPKGWRLPKAMISNSPDVLRASSDFYNLAVAYGMSGDGDSQNTQVFYNNAGPGTVPSFQLSSYYDLNSFASGERYGAYWSATFDNASFSQSLYVSPTYVGSANGFISRGGIQIRCLIAE